MAFSPEGEFHGTKGRQKKNRAKSIRERKKKSQAKWRLHCGRHGVIGKRHLEAFKKMLPVVWRLGWQYNMKWKEVGNGGSGGGLGEGWAWWEAWKCNLLNWWRGLGPLHDYHVPVLSDTEVLSQSFATHPDAQGTLCHQPRRHKDLTYQGCKAVYVTIRRFQHMM